GVIELGDIHNKSLKEILLDKRAKDMRDGFNKNICTEELCLKCSYKDRFNHLS
ncbi:MAG: SPASM domain-containing protein, partial [Sulfurovaceae bacterium]|nr:SPASM domain-containing protein [Sulfurovaceae bacterium]